MAKAIINGVEINKFVVDGGGGGELATDWSKIGYDTIPEEIQSAYDYAKQIYNTWDASITDRAGAFKDDKNMVYFPAVDLSNVQNMRDMFAKSNLTYFPANLNTSSATNMQYMFGGCNKLISLDLSNFNTSKVTAMAALANNASGLTTFICHNVNNATPIDFREAFYQCPALTTVEITHITPNNLGGTFKGCNALKTLDVSTWNTNELSSITESINSTFTGCNELEKIDGYINYGKLIKTGYNDRYAWQNCSKLRKFEARNMGMHSGMTACLFYGNYNGMQLWGENSTEIPDARQSMINTLITYSFDRASAGYSKCTISLHANAKARLTEDEIAQITAKGFTIT